MFVRRLAISTLLAFGIGGSMAYVMSPLLAQNFSPLSAQNTPRNPAGQGRTRGGPRLLQELNLTPAQTQRLRAIRAQHQRSLAQRARSLRQAQQELQQLMAGAAPASQVRSKFRQVESLRQQIAQLRFESMLAIREVLTPEQRRRFAQSLQSRRQNRSRPSDSP